MKIQIGRFALTMGFEWRAKGLPLALDTEMVRACKSATASQWMGLMEAFDLAPEAFDSPGQHLGPLLRAVVEGCAHAVVCGAPNPMESLFSGTSAFSSATWDPLSRAIASARALRPESPFHGARCLLYGPCALGVFDGLISFDGSWSRRSALILQGANPDLMTRVIPVVARAVERSLLFHASTREPGEQSIPTHDPRRL